MPTREEMRGLAEEIVGSYADRITGIAQIRETVKMDLKGFQDSRTAMAKELRADLAKSVADRKAAVNTQLKELDAAHTAMSREMRAELNKGRQTLTEEEAKRQSEAREFMGELGRVVAEGKAAVKAQLKEFADIQAGARDEWQTLTATMQAQRAGLAVEVKPPEAAAEITPEAAALRDRVFEYLANHPDGTKLAELEEEFGVARIKMAKVVRSLMDENKVEKRELYYFAV